MEKIEFENQLFNAIKKDDLKSFNSLMPTNADLNISFGRFPILSLLYLYSSYKILSKYESKLITIHNFKICPENFEMYKDFKIKAKKSLRLFNDGEIVYPVLMLAVLNESAIIKINYEFLYKNEEIEQKFKKIYKINYNFGVDNGDGKLDFPSKQETLKGFILKLIVCFFLIVSLTVSCFSIIFIKNKTGLGTKLNPILISTEQEFIQALKNKNRNYKLKNNIIISSDIKLTDFSGIVDGDNYTIIINNKSFGGLFNELSGCLKNLNINVNIENYTVNNDYSIIAKKLTGQVSNCYISGNINLNFSSNKNDDEDLFAGVIAGISSGNINDCVVDVNCSMENEKNKNAYFGLIVGKNEQKGIISNTFTTKSVSNLFGKLDADTVDIAGIACINYGTIEKCDNRISLSQTTNKEWHPNVAGISINNFGIISDCYNYGNVESVSMIDDASTNNYYVFAGGIVCDNQGVVKGARNIGNVSGTGIRAYVVVGGIAAQNTKNGILTEINTSLSKCDITAQSEYGQVVVGGIAGFSSSTINTCGFIGTIDADTNCTVDNPIFTYELNIPVVLFAGGIAGCNAESELKNCYADFTYTKHETGTEYAKLYSGVIGNVGIIKTNLTEYYIPTAMNSVENNYYVESETINSSYYGINAFLQITLNLYLEQQLYYISGEIAYIEDETKIKEYETFDEIPLEALYEGFTFLL